MRKYEKWDCPFCDQGKVEVLVFPTVYGERRSFAGVVKTKCTERFNVLEDCPECGKLAKEIERKFREM